MGNSVQLAAVVAGSLLEFPSAAIILAGRARYNNLWGKGAGTAGCRSAFVFSTFGKVGDEEKSENSTARTCRFLMPLTLHLKSLLLWLLMLEPSTEFGKSENVERSKRENNFGRRRLEAAEIYVRCILPNQEMKSSWERESSSRLHNRCRCRSGRINH